MIFFVSGDLLLAFLFIFLVVAADLAVAVVSFLAQWWWVFLLVSIPRIIYMTKKTDLPKPAFCILEIIRTAVFYAILIDFLRDTVQTFSIGGAEGFFSLIMEFFIGGLVTLLPLIGGSIICADANKYCFIHKHPVLKFLIGVWVTSIALSLRMRFRFS